MILYNLEQTYCIIFGMTYIIWDLLNNTKASKDCGFITMIENPISIHCIFYENQSSKVVVN